MMMNKRYEVMIDYPNSPYRVGDVITIEKHELHEFARHGHLVTLHSTIRQHPHIFRPMNWWEGVDIKDMPKWVKLADTGMVYKCGWSAISDTLYIIINDVFYSNIHNYTPATEAEYLAYIASLKK